MLWWSISFEEWKYGCFYYLFILFRIGQIFFKFVLFFTFEKNRTKSKKETKQWCDKVAGPWACTSSYQMCINLCSGIRVCRWLFDVFMWCRSVYCLSDRNKLECLGKDQTHQFFQNLYLINSTKVQVKVIPQTLLF